MPALLRSASLTGYAELAREVGLNPIASVCSRWGCRCPRCASPTGSCLPTPWPRYSSCRRSAVATNPSGCAWPNRAGCRTSVRSACWCARSRPCGVRFEELLRFIHLHNAALILKIEEAGGVVVIREELVVGRAAAMRQSTELAIGVLFRLLTVFLGPHWRPRLCVLRAFGAEGPHRALARVRFDASSSITISTASSATRVTSTCRILAPTPSWRAMHAKSSKRAWATSAAAPPTMSGNWCSCCCLPGIAARRSSRKHLGVTRRTVHRQLAREGETFSAHRRRRAPGTRGALRRRWRPAAVGSLGAAGLLRTQRVFALVPASFRRERRATTITLLSASLSCHASGCRRSRCASAGKSFRHRSTTASVPDAARHHRPDRPEQCRGGARFELAELVAGADEHRIDRAHAAPHLVGGFELNQRLADHDTDHVGRAATASAAKRTRRFGQREAPPSRGRRPPPREQLAADVPRDRDARQDHADDSAPSAGAERSSPGPRGRCAGCRARRSEAAPWRRPAARQTGPATWRRASRRDAR